MKEIANKLDRVLINTSWLTSFPNSTVDFKSPGASYHCPAFLCLDKSSHSPPKPFGFFNLWTLHKDFLQIVEDSWKVPCYGDPLHILFQKLKRLKRPLKDLNKAHFSDIAERVKLKKNDLQQAQLDLLNNYSIGKFNVIQNLKEDLILESAEKEFYKQMHWICEGDMRTKFFNIVKDKTKKHTVRSLLKENRDRVDSIEDISSELKNFFQKLIGSVDENVDHFSSSNSVFLMLIVSIFFASLFLLRVKKTDTKTCKLDNCHKLA